MKVFVFLTKYAVQVESVVKYKYHLERKKAFFKKRRRGRLDGKDVNVVEEGNSTRSEF